MSPKNESNRNNTSTHGAGNHKKRNVYLVSLEEHIYVTCNETCDCVWLITIDVELLSRTRLL